jgi:hypothetical protein
MEKIEKQKRKYWEIDFTSFFRKYKLEKSIYYL